MYTAQVVQLTPDHGPTVGISLAANANIKEYEPAVISDGLGSMPVSMFFYTGNLLSIRAQFHKYVDDFMDKVMEVEEAHRRKGK